jgi:hypothetical protein
MPIQPNEMSTERATERRWWPVAVPLALLAIAASLILPAGRHQWALSLFRQPTYYTSLSFDTPWALPSSAYMGAPLTFSFSVGNHEGRAITYRYLISEGPAAAGQGHAVAQSTKIVAPGATWSVSTRVRAACTSWPCRVEVSLPGHPEIIDFLVTLKGQAASNG